MNLTFSLAGLIAGALQLAVAVYALRLNRRFGAGRVGWSLFCAFTLLALAHAIQSLVPLGGLLRSGSGLEALYALVSVLLLAGMMHLETLLKERQHREALEAEQRWQLTTEVEKKTAYLTRAIEQLQAEIEAHQRLQTQFVEAQKMAILGQIVGGLTKDLDADLKKIYTSAEQVLAMAGSAASKHATEIVLAVERTSVLTAQLMAFGPNSAAQHPAVLNLNSVAAGTQGLLRRLAGPGIELVFAPHRDLARIKAAPAGVAQIVMNLVANAIDAMPEGGRLVVATETVAAKDGVKTDDAKNGQGFAVLTVSDTGAGMAPEVKARLFEPFFSTKTGGKGLGLIICQNTLKQLGGHLEVQSEPGHGTVFKAFFPFAELPAERTDILAQIAALPRGTETVLVVEDDQSVRQLAKRALDAQGYTVLVATDGQEGLKVAREHTGPIDLVVADVVMPQMDGRAMADWLKAVFPKIKILFTSGYITPDPTGETLFDTGTEFLPKPFNTASLARKVRETLDQQIPQTE
ncbi:MAG TPA: ATP-binding protein [Verrucomicrobiae bacterium]|nr:ATP-binding protein [Verrucomicrobiae bacterium]